MSVSSVLFYIEHGNLFVMCLQFPIECSLPWMLVDHVLESQNAGLIESVLIPFDIYNDSAQYALAALKQRYLYDEIEAEVYVNFSICSVILYFLFLFNRS